MVVLCVCKIATAAQHMKFSAIVVAHRTNHRFCIFVVFVRRVVRRMKTQHVFCTMGALHKHICSMFLCNEFSLNVILCDGARYKLCTYGVLCCTIFVYFIFFRNFILIFYYNNFINFNNKHNFDFIIDTWRKINWQSIIHPHRGKI